VAARLALVISIEDLVLAAPLCPHAHDQVPHPRVQRHGAGARAHADFAVLAAAPDTLIAVLVQVGKVLPELLVGRMDDVAVLDGGELASQGPDGGNVEFVLVGL
jgi:hypothetical protein